MEKGQELEKIKKSNQEVNKYDFIICPNCGMDEVGKFCPNCGQSNKDFNKPIKDIVGDLFDSINLDIRLINTLIPFFIKPGFLAQEYFRGKRKKYVAPMRMFMFISLIFFFLAQSAGVDKFKKVGKEDNTPKTDTLNQLAKIAIGDEDTTMVKYFDKLTKLDKAKLKEEVIADTSINESTKRTIIGGLNTTEKAGLFYEKFLKVCSYVLFLLMPFFALFLALILWRTKKLYVHHLIFSINFHSFVFGLGSLVIILAMILPESAMGYIAYLFWGIPVYLMLGIKRFYKRSYISAFFKTIGALSLYFFIICIVIVFIIIFTAQGFYEG